MTRDRVLKWTKHGRKKKNRRGLPRHGGLGPVEGGKRGREGGGGAASRLDTPERHPAYGQGKLLAPPPTTQSGNPALPPPPGRRAHALGGQGRRSGRRTLTKIISLHGRRGCIL
eukprot:scaffold34674_cov90-Isochrysis_galbana.AAC.2